MAQKTPDGLASYGLAHAVLREQLVRNGMDVPVGQTEERWAKEGPRILGELDTVKMHGVEP